MQSCDFSAPSLDIHASEEVVLAADIQLLSSILLLEIFDAMTTSVGAQQISCMAIQRLLVLVVQPLRRRWKVSFLLMTAASPALPVPHVMSETDTLARENTNFEGLKGEIPKEDIDKEERIVLT